MRPSPGFTDPRARRPRRPTAALAAEYLEDRLTPSGGLGTSPAAVTFSADQKTVAITAGGSTWTIARPVVSPWTYTATDTTYWVATNGSDAANGTSAHPFATIQHAVNVAGPGDIVYVEPGTYREYLQVKKSGTADHPIIISCAPNALGKVNLAPPTTLDKNGYRLAGIMVNTADYVWINGFVIQGAYGFGNAPGGTATSTGTEGIAWASGAGIGDRATNNVVYNNAHAGLKELGNGGTGIFIEGNVAFANGSSSLDHGIYMPADHVTMNGNVIFNNSGYGIQSYSHPTGQVISNNVIFGNGVGGIVIAASYSRVYNNTVVSNGQGIFYYGGACNNDVVTNNIFAFSRVDCQYGDGGTLLGKPTSIVDDYNAYYPGKPDKRLSPGPQEVLAAPLFVDAAHGDYRPAAGTPAVARGAFTPAPMYYNFQTTTAPSVTGYQPVTAATKYNTAQGFGWLSGTILGVNRQTANSLTSSSNYTTDGVFAVSLPNGTYRVTVQLGDVASARGPMSVLLEGQLVGTVTTAAGQVVALTYTVSVTDGRLEVGVKGAGNGSYAFIDSLAIAAA